MATILPKRKLEKPAELEVNPDSIPASPTPADITIDIDISAYFGNFFLINSTPNPAATVTIIAPSIGFIPSNNPIATPASDVCDRASPIIDSLLRTIVTPIQGIIVAKSKIGRAHV